MPGATDVVKIGKRKLIKQNNQLGYQSPSNRKLTMMVSGQKEDEQMDFDDDESQKEEKLTTQLDEDMVSLGYWIMKHQSNFFDNGYTPNKKGKRNCRFCSYVVMSLMILLIQYLFVSRFGQQVIEDYLQQKDLIEEFKINGTVNTYAKFINLYLQSDSTEDRKFGGTDLSELGFEDIDSARKRYSATFDPNLTDWEKWKLYIIKWPLMFLLIISVYFDYITKAKIITNIIKSIIQEDTRDDQKAKYGFIFLMAVADLFFGTFSIIQGTLLMEMSTTIIDLLGNVLSVMILTQLDLMGSLAYFYWLRNYHTKLANKDDFMVEEFDLSTRQIAMCNICLGMLLTMGWFTVQMSIGSTFIDNMFYWESDFPEFLYIMPIAGSLLVSCINFALFRCCKNYSKKVWSCCCCLERNLTEDENTNDLKNSTSKDKVNDNDDIERKESISSERNSIANQYKRKQLQEKQEDQLEDQLDVPVMQNEGNLNSSFASSSQRGSIVEQNDNDQAEPLMRQNRELDNIPDNSGDNKNNVYQEMDYNDSINK